MALMAMPGAPAYAAHLGRRPVPGQRAPHRASDPGVGDNAGQLRRHGNQERLFPRQSGVARFAAPPAPQRSRWWIWGTPRNEWNFSSPRSGRNWKLGCVSAFSGLTGSSRSATSPTKPSPGRGWRTDLRLVEAFGRPEDQAVTGGSRIYTLQTSVPMASCTRSTMISRAFGNPLGGI